MVEKVEMNTAMLKTMLLHSAWRQTLTCKGVNPLTQEELASKLTECCSSDDERDRVKSYMPEVCTGGAPTRTRQQQCVTQLKHGEHDDSQRYRPQQAC